ncbi:hypothetical protein AXA65_14805 [Chryseobacterium sp. FP211-J200]|nr:hypothetical protein AXA65_14805 [Chryseobacterium sp. FP211-J200]
MLIIILSNISKLTLMKKILIIVSVLFVFFSVLTYIFITGWERGREPKRADFEMYENKKLEDSIKSITTKKTKSTISEKKISEIQNQSFVISCGSGCAMTYKVKEINQINQVSIEVTFEVDMYIDEQITETFDETYVFSYGNINTIRNKKSDEYIEKIFTESAQQSFTDFGAKLIRSGILTD